MYWLSKIVPVRFKAQVQWCCFPDGALAPTRSTTWWQWRNHIWALKSKPILVESEA